MAAIIFCCASSAHAQPAQVPDAVFVTENAYRSNHPDYMLTGTDWMQFNDFFDGHNLKFTCNGHRVKLEKDQLYGYRYRHADYRVYHHSSYQIIDTAGFVLYTRTQLPQRPKFDVPAEVYYYSTADDGKIQPLTLYNLLRTFKKQPELRYALTGYFRSDRDLSEYDDAEHEYKLKYLYKKYMGR